MIASQMSEFNIGDKWVNLRVTKWPIVECVHERIQLDGYVKNLLYDQI